METTRKRQAARLLRKGPTIARVQRLSLDGATSYLMKTSNIERMWRPLAAMLGHSSVMRNFDEHHFAASYLVLAFSSSYDDDELVRLARCFLTTFEEYLSDVSNDQSNSGEEATAAAVAYYDYFVTWRESQIRERKLYLENELRTLCEATEPSASLLVSLQENLHQLALVAGDEHVRDLVAELRLV